MRLRRIRKDKVKRLNAAKFNRHVVASERKKRLARSKCSGAFGKCKKGRSTNQSALCQFINSSPIEPKIAKKKNQISFPKEFSFIENPIHTIQSLKRLAKIAISKKSRFITIDQSQCELVDHCAESVLAALGKDAKRRHRILFDGNFPGKSEQRDIVIATGLTRALNIKGIEEPKGFLKFPLRRGASQRATGSESNPSEVIATKLTEYVDTCLKSYGFELTPTAGRYLSSIAGEVIGNAEDHSGMPHWWVSGYVRRLTKKFADCHLTFFNFGKTIYESMMTLPEDSLLRKRIDALVSHHTEKAHFFPSKWTVENLWTLYALQEGVSRKNVDKDRVGNRGQGTAKLICFFQELGQTSRNGLEPKMCLVSGETHITFDMRHKMTIRRNEDNEERWIIAFNDNNNLLEPPDPNSVQHMPEKFPGTLISLRFFFDVEHLEGLVR